MRILVGNNHLQKTGGTENYTYALALELKRKGHEVNYFTFFKGEISDKLEQHGIPFMSWQYYDLILANHTTVIKHLFRYGYIIQTCHGIIPDLEQPSPLADKHVVISGELKEYLRSKGVKSECILNGIDCTRFTPQKPLSPQLSCVLSLSQSDELNTFMKECCDEIGVKFMSCNKHTDNVWEIEGLINEVDLVVGIGRSLYDAMACGRCILSYDDRGTFGKAIGDGYINKENVEKSIYHNFIGRGAMKTFSKDEFINELKKYNPEDGKWAREYALKNLNIENVANIYLSLHEPYQQNQLQYLHDKMQKLYDMKYEIPESEKKQAEALSNFSWANSKRIKYLKAIRLMGYSIGLLIFTIVALLLM